MRAFVPSVREVFPQAMPRRITVIVGLFDVHKGRCVPNDFQQVRPLSLLPITPLLESDPCPTCTKRELPHFVKTVTGSACDLLIASDHRFSQVP